MPRRALRNIASLAVATIAIQHPPIASAQLAAWGGTVLDETGTPIAGATVNATCRDAAGVATTGADGAFQLHLSDVIGACHLVISRLGFQSVSIDVPVGRLTIGSRVVMKKQVDTAVTLGTRARAPLFATGAPLSSRWQMSAAYAGGQASAAGLERTFEHLAGGARWKADWQAQYVTRSGFTIAGAAQGRRGYGMPVFMSSPFLGGQTLPDFSPAQSSESQWNAMVTMTTPPVHFGSATLAAALQAFTQVGGGGSAATVKTDRGARGVIRIRFK